MMMRLKYGSSSIFSSFCRRRLNPNFSAPPYTKNPSSSSKLFRYFSSSSSSDSSSSQFSPKPRCDNPYIDSNGYYTGISLDQLEEFKTKYPRLYSEEDIDNNMCPLSSVPIPYPHLVDNRKMFIAVPFKEIKLDNERCLEPALEGSEALFNYDDCRINDLEVVLDAYGWKDSLKWLPKDTLKHIDFKKLRPKKFGDPPVISEEIDALLYPPMTDFRIFWKYCEEKSKLKQNHEENNVQTKSSDIAHPAD